MNHGSQVLDKLVLALLFTVLVGTRLASNISLQLPIHNLRSSCCIARQLLYQLFYGFLDWFNLQVFILAEQRIDQFLLLLHLSIQLCNFRCVLFTNLLHLIRV
jgi:hypothetical protein